jgi:hypothetical protein
MEEIPTIKIDIDSKTNRMNQRDTQMNEEAGLNAFEARTENYCSRVQTHINMMYRLGGKHLDDIPHYIYLLKQNNCDNWENEKRTAIDSGYYDDTEERIDDLIQQFNSVFDKNQENARKIYDQIYELIKSHIIKHPAYTGVNQEKMNELYTKYMRLYPPNKSKGGNKNKKRKNKSRKSKRSKKTKSRRH